MYGGKEGKGREGREGSKGREGRKGGKGVQGIYRGPPKGSTFESTGVPQKVGKLTMGGEGGEGVYYQQVRIKWEGASQIF